MILPGWEDIGVPLISKFSTVEIRQEGSDLATY